MKMELLRNKTMVVEGVTLYRMYWPDRGEEGGWAADSFVWDEKSTALIYGSSVFFGGTIEGGTIWGGTIEGGTIRGGTIRGGTIGGGTIRGGTIRGGTIRGGTIRGGTIRGGTIRGGEHTQSPAMAQRSDGYCFIVHRVDGELRVWAGCRNLSWSEAVEYWDKSHPHHAESTRIIKFLRKQVEARES